MGMLCYEPPQRLTIHEVRTLVLLLSRRQQAESCTQTCSRGRLHALGVNVATCAALSAAQAGPHPAAEGSMATAEACIQVLQAPWVVTQGGTVPKPLAPTVARGAANTAAMRRYQPCCHDSSGIRLVVV